MATSKLQRLVGNMLDKAFPQCRVRENYRPDWLVSSRFSKLELDFYIEELKIAFEIQGMQHFEFISYFFRTKEDFERRKRYDQEKKDLCFGKGVRLYEILTETDAIIAIKELRAEFYFEETFPVYANQAAMDAAIDESDIENKRKREARKNLKGKKQRRKIAEENHQIKLASMTEADKKMKELCLYHKLTGKALGLGKPLDFDFSPTYLSKSMINELVRGLRFCKNLRDIQHVFAIQENEILKGN